MKIQENLFDLTEEQTKSSKSIYNGNVIKCLVAPYHSYEHLKVLINSDENTYIFPERNFSYTQLFSFISNLIQHENSNEIKIITSSYNIILDMINSSVRILEENNEIVECHSKTLQANIHNIRYNILESTNRTLYNKAFSVNFINDLITKINSINEKNKITKTEYNKLQHGVNLIGEEVIAYKLKEKLDDIKQYVIKDDSDYSKLEKFIEEQAIKSKDPNEYRNILERLVLLYRENNMSDDDIITQLKK